jgi:UDP-2,4-diacetamido-2,4,6-trideoxy-beta-L-altropyranose hydrolase
MTAGTLIIRADASVEIGTGHVMRCLALAQAWQDAGGDVVFAMARSTPAVEDRLCAERVVVFKLDAIAGDATQVIALARSRQAQWVVADGYAFGSGYQHEIKNAALKLLWVDDGGQQEHYSADLILNQNTHARESMYPHREPHTRLLLGPRYAMLRREFGPWREFKREIARVGSKVLVTMGGSDPDNVTLRVIEALQAVAADRLEITVVAGGSNPHFGSLQQAVSLSGRAPRLLRNAANMPELMAWADIAISAAGTTCWEMCLLGLPAMVIDLAPNQLPVALELARSHAAIHLGNTRDVTVEKIGVRLEFFLRSPDLRSTMSQRGRELVDGRGAQRVVCAMREPTLKLRRAEERDCRLLWEWANDPLVRAASFSQAPISWDEHRAWFAGKMKDQNCLILIGENEQGQAIGQFRLEWRSSVEGEIDVSLAPAARGKGYGAALVESGVREVFSTTATERVHAFIRPENQASIRLFERAAFVALGEEQVKKHKAIHYIRRREQA